MLGAYKVFYAVHGVSPGPAFISGHSRVPVRNCGKLRQVNGMEAFLDPNARSQYPSFQSSGPGPLPSQLDSIETTADTPLPSCYAEYRRTKHRVEFESALELYSDLDNIHHQHRASSLEECKKYAWFTRHKETGQVRVVANACRLRWCPVCAEAKRVRIKSEVSHWLQTVRAPKFFTLTMSHSSEPLSSQIKNLYRGFRLLRQHKRISREIRGGVWFFQIKRSARDACWHPHLHILMDANFIDKRLLSLEWFNVTGNSFIIDIRAIKDPGKVADYVSRYCAKPCNMSDYTKDDRIEIATVLHGKRLCGRFGTGAQCDFKSRAPENRTMWERLGTWYDIIVNRRNDPIFHKIKFAYFGNVSIERSLCEHLIRTHDANQMSLSTSGPAVSSRQLYFEEFVRR